jgi:ABC-type antimicrobial peptide transport system permease subunit
VGLVAVGDRHPRVSRKAIRRSLRTLLKRPTFLAVSVLVNQRAHEIGIRMAMGAQRGDVLRMVIADGMKPVVARLALGILSVFALTRALATLLFAVSASDPATLAWVTFLFCGVSIVALLVPDRRAAKIDPLEVLRTD